MLVGLFLCNLFLLSVVIGFVFFSPVDSIISWMEDLGFQEQVQSGRDAIFQLPSRWIEYARQSADIPQVVIDIKFKHLQKLKMKRKEAVAKGILVQGDDDFVPASIRVGSEAVKVKLRLKGDWADQFEKGRWLFRVHVKGKQQLFGLRRFSLHHPSARHYHGEPMFLRFVQSEGILAPRYNFVDVVLNGDYLGRMALEEHFSKELLESQGRKESVILKFDESLLWASNESWEKRGFDGVYDSYTNAKIVPFGKSKIKKSPALSKNLETATGLLRGFVNGQMLASEVFDVDLMGKFLAISQTWGAWHALRWHNVRFYFNPLTVRLEPIAYDANVWDPFSWHKLINTRDPLSTALLRDPQIWKTYLITLQRLAEELREGKRLEWVKSLESMYRGQLGEAYPFLAEYDLTKLHDRAKKLLDSIQEHNGIPMPELPRYLSAFVYDREKRSYLELANMSSLPLEIVSIRWQGNVDSNVVPFEPRTKTEFPFSLPPDSKI